MIRAIQYLTVVAIVIFLKSQSCEARDVVMLVNEVKSVRSLPLGRLSVKSTFPIEEVARKCADEIERNHGLARSDESLSLEVLDGAKLVSTNVLVCVTTNVADALGRHFQYESALVCSQWRTDGKKEMFSFHVMDYSRSAGWTIRPLQEPSPATEKVVDHPPSDADLADFVKESDIAGRDFVQLSHGNIGCVLLSVFVEDCPSAKRELQTMLTPDEVDSRMQHLIKATGRRVRP